MLFGAFARTSLCPIGAGEKIIHGVHIQSGWVRADGELITMGFDYLCHAASVSHHGIIAEIHVIARASLFFAEAIPDHYVGDCFGRKSIALAMT